MLLTARTTRAIIFHEKEKLDAFSGAPAPMPEPGSLLLLTAGTLIVLRHRRRLARC
jgi:hypothetical protein